MGRQIRHDTTVTRDQDNRSGKIVVNSEYGTIEAKFSLFAEMKDKHFLIVLEAELLDRLVNNQKEQEYESNRYY